MESWENWNLRNLFHSDKYSEPPGSLFIGRTFQNAHVSAAFYITFLNFVRFSSGVSVTAFAQLAPKRVQRKLRPQSQLTILIHFQPSRTTPLQSFFVISYSNNFQQKIDPFYEQTRFKKWNLPGCWLFSKPESLILTFNIQKEKEKSKHFQNPLNFLYPTRPALQCFEIWSRQKRICFGLLRETFWNQIAISQNFGKHFFTCPFF